MARLQQDSRWSAGGHRALARPPSRAQLLLAAVAATQAGAQIEIRAPEAVQEQFSKNGGFIYGTTATFGAPTDRMRVFGELLYGETKGRNHCEADDYSLPTSGGIEGSVVPQRHEGDAKNIVIVRRGGCSFVTKVRIAQEKQAHAVIIVDKEDSDLSPEDIQKIVMADDGSGKDIVIPTVMISKHEGQLLISAVRKESVLAELRWDIPMSEVVTADFWMSAGSRESDQFLLRFEESANLLAHKLQFVPHYHVFTMPESPEGRTYNHLCAAEIDGCPSCRPKADRFCAPDPDGLGPITGADVVNEDLRQSCIWNTTAQRAPDGTGSLYSAEFWHYVVDFSDRCPLRRANKKFGYECSKQAMDAVGISVSEVEACVRARYNSILQEHVDRIAWSAQALRINGWRYSGPLDPELVLKAMCSAYATAPNECEQLLAGYGGASLISVGLTVFDLSVALLILASVLGGIFWVYKKYLAKSVRAVLREEVMLEVQSQMNDYVSMDDGDGQKRGTLSF